MNHKNTFKTLGAVMLVEAAFMLPSLILAFCLGEPARPFICSILITAALGMLLRLLTRGQSPFSSRSAFVTAAAVWLAFSLAGCLPFCFCTGFGSFIDCLFESVSGFTTTGSSILYDIEALPRSILLWRSTTHFIGGMGILVLASAVLPSRGDRSYYLLRAEMPGPTKDKLLPKLADTAKILYLIYIVLTLTQIIALLIAGLGVFDSVNIALATAGTGGFSVKNASMAGYGNPAAELITAVYMLLFGVNFSVYFLIITGRISRALKSDELRFYLFLAVAASAVIALNARFFFASPGEALRLSFFTVTSTMSSTGFSVTDYDLWPEFSKSVIVLLMLIGACAGSTGGGIKCSRALMLLRAVACELRQIVHPHLVSTVRMDGKLVDDSTLRSVSRFFAAYVLLLFAGVIVISADGLDFTTNFTAVLSCLSNIGPGLSKVGPACNFAAFSPVSKLALSLLMLFGRLEIFPILVFLSPYSWKKS